MTKPPCFNRPAYKNTVMVQDGWLASEHSPHPFTFMRSVPSRVPVMREIPDPMSKDCPQIRPPFGEAYLQNWDCEGCHWASGDTATDN